MRFRAKLDKEHFAVFFNQMQQLGQLGKDAILCFDPTMIRSVLKNDDEALQVFATVIVVRAGRPGRRGVVDGGVAAC